VSPSGKEDRFWQGSAREYGGSTVLQVGGPPPVRPTAPPAPTQNISSPISPFSSLGRRPCVSWLVEASGRRSTARAQQDPTPLAGVGESDRSASPRRSRARAPSPTQRRRVNKSRVAVGEGWGEGDNAACLRTNQSGLSLRWTSNHKPSFTGSTHDLRIKCPERASDMSRGSSEANNPGTPPPRTPAPRTGCQNACLAPTT
jgi:hypothetical protein